MKKTAAVIIILLLASVFFILGVLYFVRDTQKPNRLHGVEANAAPHAGQMLPYTPTGT